jgi:hypothetical protein
MSGFGIKTDAGVKGMVCVQVTHAQSVTVGHEALEEDMWAARCVFEVALEVEGINQNTRAEGASGNLVA